MKIMAFAILGLTFFAALSACSSYQGLRIVEPAHKQTVASLRPTLRWDAVEGTGVTYDLVIYEGEEISPVDQREGLTGTMHQVEEDLRPSTTYRWSVRSREGSAVSEWSKHQTQVFTGVTYHRRARIPQFTTPAAGS